MDRDLDQLLGFVTRLLADHDSVSSLPQRLVEACVRITGLAGGAITLEYASQERMTVAATDHCAARLEDLQEVVREGPGWSAHRDFEAVSGDLSESPARWPTLAAAAVEEMGPMWMCAAPIRAGSELIGVLTLHGPTTGQDVTTGHDSAVVVAELGTVQFLADVVGAALFAAVDSQIERGDSWIERAKVNQAGGMVSSQLSVPIADALALLRAHAFTGGISLVDVADQVLHGSLLFTPRPKEEPVR
ncbi:MAG: GAF and ANTAR domain-containing protein [Lapillicoccus sp.]